MAALLLAAAWLAGCAAPDAPRAGDRFEVGQEGAHALHRWDALARDVAARLAQGIATWPQGEHPIHVSAAGTSDFDEGFVKLLRVHLLEQGVALSEAPSAVELRVQAQLVDPAGRGGAAGGAGRAEVLVTTTLMNDGRYLTGTADTCDVERGDASLYVPPPPPPVMKTWKVVTP